MEFCTSNILFCALDLKDRGTVTSDENAVVGIKVVVVQMILRKKEVCMAHKALNGLLVCAQHGWLHNQF